jgi:tRNA G18 (ribose-2'-O)-methylase SpoU
VFSLPCLRVEQLEDIVAGVDLQPVAAMPPGWTGSSEAPSDGGAGKRLPERCLLLLGHETRGLELTSGVGVVTVPQVAELDSLNVAMAGSILMAAWYGDRSA